MKIYIEKSEKKIEMKFQGTVAMLLKKLKISKEAVLIVRNNSLITEDEKLTNKDEIKIISVISGG